MEGRAHLTCGGGGGSAAGSRQFAVTAETGAEDTQPAGKREDAGC